MTVRAVWNGRVLAESDDTLLVEGNQYFPPDSVRREYFTRTRLHSLCPWKGVASYYTVAVGKTVYKNAAWFYPHPFPLARKLKNHVAFWPDVQIVDDEEKRD